MHAHFKDVRVNLDYHVEYDKHFYSVPFFARPRKLEVCATAMTVEILKNNKRVTSHVRSYVIGGYTTNPSTCRRRIATMPSGRRRG